MFAVGAGHIDKWRRCSPKKTSHHIFTTASTKFCFFTIFNLIIITIIVPCSTFADDLPADYRNPSKRNTSSFYQQNCPVTILPYTFVYINNIFTRNSIDTCHGHKR